MSRLIRSIGLRLIGAADRLDGNTTNLVQHATIAGRLTLPTNSIAVMRSNTFLTS